MKPLAVQLYTVRDELAADPDGTLRRLADIGYQAVEATLAAVGDDPVRFRAVTDELGLTVTSMHAPVLDGDRDAIARAARVIGTDTVVLPGIPAAGFADAEAVADSAARLTEAAAWAGERGLRLAYHNHYWEITPKIGGRTALEAFADQLPADVLLEVDVYWAHTGGVDVPALLGVLGERVKFLHVKDGPATVEDAMTAVGAGVVPIPEILAAAPADAWRIVELDRCDTDMMTAVADSYTYLEGSGVRA